MTFVRWALWSPRRLTGVTIVALALVVMMGATRPHHPPVGAIPPGPRPIAPAMAGVPAAAAFSAPAASATTADSTTTSTTSSDSSIPATPTVAPVPIAGAVAKATAFVTVWAGHQPKPVWLAALAPLSTPTLAQGFTYSDPSSVLATKIIGAASITDARAGATDVTVTTDGGPVVVTVAAGGLVANVAATP